MSYIYLMFNSYHYRWLDITPVGRIITRSTQDINAIDEQFVEMLRPFFELSIALITFFSITVWMAGRSAFIPGLILMILGGFFGRVYLLAQIGIRREMSIAKAPVLGQLSTALGGISNISKLKRQPLQLIQFASIRPSIFCPSPIPKGTKEPCR